MTGQGIEKLPSKRKSVLSEIARWQTNSGPEKTTQEKRENFAAIRTAASQQFDQKRPSIDGIKKHEPAPFQRGTTESKPVHKK